MNQLSHGASKKKRPTIHDVAELANISYATVSRYINNNPHVDPDTSKRIAEAIKQLNYKPRAANAHTNSQQPKHLPTVAMVYRGKNDVTMASLSSMRIMMGANARLSEEGYQMVTLFLNDDDAIARLPRILASHLADAYLVLIPSQDTSIIKPFEKLSCPVVTSGYGAAGESVFPTVNIDNRQATADITRYILKKGRTKLAYMEGPRPNFSCKERLAGFRDAAHNLTNVVYCTANGWGREDGMAAAESISDHFGDIDALICANDTLAIGAMSVLRRHGKRVPEDVAVAGFDNSPEALSATPQLTTVEQYLERNGREMANIAIRDLRNGKKSKPYTILIPTEVVPRESA